MSTVINKIDETVASLVNDRDAERNEEDHILDIDSLDYVCNVYDQAIEALNSVKGTIIGEGVNVTGTVPRAPDPVRARTRTRLDVEGLQEMREAFDRGNTETMDRMIRPPVIGRRVVHNEEERVEYHEARVDWGLRQNAQMPDEPQYLADGTEDIREVVAATPLAEQARTRAVGH